MLIIIKIIIILKFIYNLFYNYLNIINPSLFYFLFI